MSLFKVFYILEDDNRLENGYQKVEASSAEEAISMVPGGKDAREIDVEIDLVNALDSYVSLRDTEKVIFYNSDVYNAVLSYMYHWSKEKPFERRYDVSRHLWNDRIHQTICVSWYENGECKNYVFGSYV